jgi:hypothetical protein
MKMFGAKIYCAICSAQPYPDDPSIRETFDLRRFGPNGAPTASPAEGEWRCSEHFPPRQRVPSTARVTPLEAVAEFERLLTAEGARLEEALAEDSAGLLADFKAYSGEVARALAEVKKALTPQKPPPSLDDAPRSRRLQKKIKAKERRGDGQQDWVSGTAQPASGDSP